MDSSDDSKKSFFKHVFNFDNDTKSELLNIVQYAIMAIIPVVLVNKGIANYVPEADDKKNTLELMAEIIIQIVVMFLGLFMIDRIITYFPTYSGEKYPDHEFSVIMGSDSLDNIEKWKNGDLILKRYEICVYERLNYPVKQIPGANIISLKAPLFEISASLIRKLIKEGKSIRYMVPDSVMNEILKSGYYK